MGSLEALISLSAVFDREGIKHAVIGAYALHAFGYSRATKDIDFVVHSNDRQKVHSHLESLGFEAVYASSGFSNHVHPLGLRVDFLYVSGTTAHEIFAASTVREIDSVRTVPVVSAAHLVALKVFAIKNNPERLLRDAADISELLRTSAVDADTVRSVCERYDQTEVWEFIHKKSSGP